jgi:CRP/FNR family transcriptional regulator, cyclic AMP receptor protein
MSLANPLTFCSQSTMANEKNPSAALYERIEQLFGARCASLVVKRNSVICVQGAKLSCLYLIRKGKILLSRVSADGRETVISILGPGEFFGESSLLSGTAITYTATATRRSELMRFPEAKFKILLEDPQSCRMLLSTVTQRCDDAWAQMEILGCTYVRQKVRSGLIWLSGRMGVNTRQGVRIDLNQTQMARMVGCARETLSREMSELRRLNAIDVRPGNGRKELFVVNHEELSQPI